MCVTTLTWKKISNQGQNLALAGLFDPNSLDSGRIGLGSVVSPSLCFILKLLVNGFKSISPKNSSKVVGIGAFHGGMTFPGP